MLCYPKISIVTVCYNSAATIEQTIQSVLGQSYPNIEYIIIDGGSTDGTVDIIKKYASQLAYWVSEPDKGIYDAMNKGIWRTSGDIIGIINSDDWYADKALSMVADYFVSHEETALLHGDMIEVAQSGRQRIIKGLAAGKEEVLSWYEHPTVFIRKSVYNKFGGYSLQYKILSDGEFMLRLRYGGASIGYIHQVLACFRLGGVSNTECLGWKRFREYKRIAEDLKDKQAVPLKDIAYLDEQLRKLKCDTLCNYLRKRMRRIDLWQSCLKSILVRYKKKRYVIWGTGQDGAIIYQDFVDDLFLLEGFLDSDVHKQGQLFNGFMIYNVDNIALHDKLIIVASRNYSGQIAYNLFQRGLREDKDFLLFDSYQKEKYGLYLEKRL